MSIAPASTIARLDAAADLATAARSETAPAPHALRRAAMRGGLYLIARQAVSVMLKFIGVMLITRVLGPDGYGAYVSGLNIYQYTAMLAQTGIGVYLLRYEGDIPDATFRTAYTLLAVLGLLLAAAFEVGAPGLSHWVGVDGFGEITQILMLALPCQLLALPASVRLERDLDYRRVATLEILGQLAFYLLAIPLMLSGCGPSSLAFGWLLQQAVTCVAAHLMARRRPDFGFDAAAARAIAGYAANFSAASWIWQLRILVNPMVVGPALGAQAVGLVGMTISLLEMLSIIKTIIWRLSVAILAKVQHNRDKLRQAVEEGMELQTLAVGAILLGFGWTGAVIVPWLFGARWSGLMEIYPYLAAAYLANASFNMHSSVLSVLCRNGELAIFHGVHVALFASIAMLLVPHFGVAGYGFGELAALASYGVVHAYLARAVGSPRYLPVATWWLGIALGLFWRELGLWAAAAPFLALALPPSPARLIGFYRRLKAS
jgi:PST family polysaccharide transporter